MPYSAYLLHLHPLIPHVISPCFSIWSTCNFLHLLVTSSHPIKQLLVNILQSINSRHSVKRIMSTQVEERFTEFYEKWCCQLEEILRPLLRACSKSSPSGNATRLELEALMSKLTAHHKDYYTVKWATAHQDVLAFFIPVWTTPLECAYLWVTGWKPSMAFRLFDSLKQTDVVDGVSDEQLNRLNELRMKIKKEEEKVEGELERQQMSMAGRRMVELARMSSHAGNEAAIASRVDGLVEVALKGLLSGLENVMKAADCVRLKTLKGVLDILNPKQGADWLAAVSMLLIQLRKWGKQRNRSLLGN